MRSFKQLHESTMSMSQLEKLAGEFEKIYDEKYSAKGGSKEALYQMLQEMMTIAGDLKSTNSWGVEFLEQRSKVDQYKFFFQDFYPILKASGYPLPMTKELQNAWHDMKQAAIKGKLVNGHKYPKKH